MQVVAEAGHHHLRGGGVVSEITKAHPVPSSFAIILDMMGPTLRLAQCLAKLLIDLDHTYGRSEGRRKQPSVIPSDGDEAGVKRDVGQGHAVPLGSPHPFCCS